MAIERFHVVLDSTVFGEVPLAHQSDLRRLSRFADLTESVIIVPDIVIQETEARLPAAVQASFQDARRGLNNLAGVPEIKFSLLRVDESTVVSSATALFKRNIANLGFVVRPSKVGHDEVVRRLLTGRRPFGQKRGGDEEGCRDYLVWRTAIEVALENSGSRVILISNDKAAFGVESKEPRLAPDLESEIDDLGVRLEWYLSPQDFLLTANEELSSRASEAILRFVASGEAHDAIIEMTANAFLDQYYLDLDELGIPKSFDDLEIVAITDPGSVSVESAIDFSDWDNMARLRLVNPELVIQQVIDADDPPPLDESEVTFEVSPLSRRHWLARAALPVGAIDIEISFGVDQQGRVSPHYLVIDDIQL